MEEKNPGDNVSNNNPEPATGREETPFWIRFLLYSAMGVTLVFILNTLCNN